jgi:hypothetical protein
VNATLTYDCGQTKDVEVVLTRTDILYLLLELDDPLSTACARRDRLVRTATGENAGIWITVRIEPGASR